MVPYDQIQITNNAAKFEQNLNSVVEEFNQQSSPIMYHVQIQPIPITPPKCTESKWQCNMINIIS